MTGYRIFYQHEKSVTVDASATQYTISNFDPSTTYSISMVALSEHLPSAVAGPVTLFNKQDLGKSCCEMLFLLIMFVA